MSEPVYPSAFALFSGGSWRLTHLASTTHTEKRKWLKKAIYDLYIYTCVCVQCALCILTKSDFSIFELLYNRKTSCIHVCITISIYNTLSFGAKEVQSSMAFGDCRKVKTTTPSPSPPPPSAAAANERMNEKKTRENNFRCDFFPGSAFFALTFVKYII